MSKVLLVPAFFLLTLAMACKSTSTPAGRGTFGEDVAFLKEHVETLVLSDAKGAARIAVVPDYQGRVMTSTAGGDEGRSHGWLNRELIASGRFEPHINAFGGEDRFWIGPEGGQFAVFFAPNTRFELADWQTPAPLDREPFALVESSAERAVLKKRMQLQNRSGTRFDIEVTREIRLRDPAQVLAAMSLQLPEGVRGVGFESVNTITNVDAKSWSKETGLLSIWIVGMFNASPATTVAVPFQAGPEAIRGPIVNDRYFGKVPEDRLLVKRDQGVLLFKADARHRCKIGVGPKRATDVLGSWDAEHGVLTLVQYTQPQTSMPYVNSMWELQDDPYAGDVVNSYCDGPPKPGAKQLGQFYELETSSPALMLAPKQRATHAHRTLHFEGDRAGLDALARRLLGVGLDELAAFAKR
jgi:hypothetical protein